MKHPIRQRLRLLVLAVSLVVGGSLPLVTATSAATSTAQAATLSWYNQSILNQGFSAPIVETLPSVFTSAFTYRYGRPEGIVVHETANSQSTLADEVSYMRNNWQTIGAFVHGFVADSKVVVIADLNKGVWGSGPVANQRYLQFEMVRMHSQLAFDHEIYNHAYYMAQLLLQYGLKPVWAETNGGSSSSTIWSHHDVTRYLGGTNHTDPDGYFSSWGYSMRDYVGLLTYLYNKIALTVASQESVAKTAQITKGSYDTYYLNNAGFIQASHTSDYYLGGTYGVSKLATTSQGTTLALLTSAQGNPLLWIDARALTYRSDLQPVSTQTVNETASVTTNGLATYYLLATGFQATGQTTTGLMNHTYRILKRTTTNQGSTFALLANAQGQPIVWVPASALTSQATVTQSVATSKTAVIPAQTPTYRYQQGTLIANGTTSRKYVGVLTHTLSMSAGPTMAEVSLDGRLIYVPLAQVTVGATTIVPNIQALNDIATVKAATTLVGQPGSQEAVLSVAANSRWRVTGQATSAGITYYQLGLDAWLPASAVTLASGTTTQAPVVEKKVVTVMTKGGATTWTQAGGRTVHQRLPYLSRWRVTATKTVAGQTYYQVGRQDWLSAQAVN